MVRPCSGIFLINKVDELLVQAVEWLNLKSIVPNLAEWWKELWVKSQYSEKREGSGDKLSRFETPALPLLGCVDLGESLNLSEPLFSKLQIGDDNNTSLMRCL